jgi:hypothetical protein
MTEYSVPESSIAFCRELAKRFPQLSPLLIEHENDNDEVLPHVFFGDVRRFVEEQLDRGDEAQLKPLFEFFEEAYVKGDEPIENVIAVSLLEDLWDRPEIKPLLGPAMAQQYSKYVS